MKNCCEREVMVWAIHIHNNKIRMWPPTIINQNKRNLQKETNKRGKASLSQMQKNIRWKALSFIQPTITKQIPLQIRAH